MYGWKKIWIILMVFAFCVFLGVSVVFASSESNEITFWKFADVQGDKLLQPYVDKWNATYTPKVQFVSIPVGEYEERRLPTAFAAGAGPDVFWVSSGDFLRYYNDGLLEPFDSYLSQEEINDMHPVARGRVTVDGHIYGLPIEMEPLALFYSKKAFSESGLSETAPASWEELIDMAMKLTKENRYGLAFWSDPPTVQLPFWWYPWLWSAGGDVVTDDWSKSVINSDAGVAALQLWGDLINKYKVSPRGELAIPYHNPALLAEGITAIQEVGVWSINMLKETYPEFEYGVFPIPPREVGGKSISVIGGWAQVVNAKSPHVEDAVRFTRWLIYDTDFLAYWNITGPYSRFPTLNSMIDKYHDFYSQSPINIFTKDILPTSRPEPRYPPAMRRYLMDAIQGVIYGNISAQEAANVAAEKIDEFLSTYKGAH